DRPRRVVTGDDLEDPEHDHRDREQERDRRQAAADEKPGHQVLMRTWARGSSASRTPSPRMLMLSTVSTSIAPGIRARCGVVSMIWIPSESRVPHDALGACTPAPRNDR